MKKSHFNPGCPPHGNMAMSLQLVIQILVGRENLPKVLTLPGRKKKEKEDIQNVTPVGLEAFKKNDTTYLGEMPSDHDPPLVEVVQEGVSFPQPSEKETQAAMEELMNELNGMVDQATQTCPPPSPPPEDDNEGLKRMVRMATIFQSPAIQNPRLRPPPSSVDYMVCPCHEVRLEERQSQKGWHCQMSHSTLFAVLW